MTEENKKSEKKEEMKIVKKTVDAHGTTSEKINEKATDKMIEVSEKEDSNKAAEEKVEEIKKEEEKDKKGKFKGRRKRSFEPTREEIVSAWEPKTELGKDVKNEKIKNIDEILDANKKILEPEIIDKLLNVKSDLINIGQAKGKFGGGKRRAWRQTQRKTKEGNVMTFSALAVVGDENGHIGFGVGKAKETLPARDKAIRKAKLNLIKIKRDCSAFDCDCSDPHSVPFKVEGKAGSVRIVFTPAPQGTRLVVANELKKILKLAGIKDVYSKTYGSVRTTFNLVKACFDALEKTNTGGIK